LEKLAGKAPIQSHEEIGFPKKTSGGIGKFSLIPWVLAVERLGVYKRQTKTKGRGGRGKRLLKLLEEREEHLFKAAEVGEGGGVGKKHEPVSSNGPLHKGKKNREFFGGKPSFFPKCPPVKGLSEPRRNIDQRKGLEGGVFIRLLEGGERGQDTESMRDSEGKDVLGQSRQYLGGKPQSSGKDGVREGPPF